MDDNDQQPTAPATAASQAGTGDGFTEFREHLSYERLLKLQPWRSELSMQLEFVKDAEGTGAEAWRTDFVNAIKAKSLTADEVLVGQYMVLGNMLDRRFFVASLLTLTPHQRVVAHNWRVLSLPANKVLLNQRGHLMATGRHPLLPAIEDFKAENLRILNLMQEEYDAAKASAEGPQGAGRQQARRKGPDIYKEDDKQPRGAGYMAPIAEMGGRYFANLSEVESAFNHQARELEATKQMLQRLQQDIATTRKATTTNNNGQQNKFGGQQQQQQRGRGGGQGPRGGEAPDFRPVL